MKKELICIVCPRGCHLTIDENLTVSGNFCKRGEIYARNEIKNPTRIITTTVAVTNGTYPRLSVKTSVPIPKNKIFDVMGELRKVKVNAPIKLGDVIVKNILDTGSDIVATESITAR
jgi:CxxC motif-containing protein